MVELLTFCSAVLQVFCCSAVFGKLGRKAGGGEKDQVLLVFLTLSFRYRIRKQRHSTSEYTSFSSCIMTFLGSSNHRNQFVSIIIYFTKVYSFGMKFCTKKVFDFESLMHV